MSLRKDEYKKRLIDDRINEYLNIFGAILIVGPKWCGKTWTSLNHANSVVYLSNKDTRNLAKAGFVNILDDNFPELIDEWQLVPSIWDDVRNECDKSHKKGKFILTGSTTIQKDEDDEIYHSGAGRFAILRMYPMSLYESGDSTGDVSISDMINNTVKQKHLKEIPLKTIASLIVRGGWPENQYDSIINKSIIPKNYIDVILNKDIHERKDKKRDINKMTMLLRSLARNESSTAGDATLINDIFINETDDDKINARATISDYIGVLEDLYLISNQDAFSINYRSSTRVGKTPKRHFVDPSLACAILDLNEDKLLSDFNTFGLMFESLVERDLLIYAEELDAKLFHFRDNQSGDEVDAILEFRDGNYAAFEIKLSVNNKEEALNSLKKFYDSVSKKPLFMCAIIGNYQAITKDSDTGIYILPITALKP